MKKHLRQNIFQVFLCSLLIFDFDTFATDYCKEDLCPKNVWHTACPGGKPHNNNFQSTCPTDAALIVFSENDKNYMLRQHNQKRENVAQGGLKFMGIKSACRIGAMAWDNELEHMAELHVKSCIFKHDNCRNTETYLHSGQNIAQHSSTATQLQNNLYYIEFFIRKWYEEYRDVKDTSVLDKYFKVKGPAIGHFLAVINERNVRVGCAAASYSEKESWKTVLFTCNYASNNIIGAAIYNTCKNPGLKCKSGRDKTFRNLCSTSEVYNMTGILEHIPYDHAFVTCDGDIWLVVTSSLLTRWLIMLVFR